MVNYAKMQATAKRLIEANGVSVTLGKRSEGIDSADEPWRGTRVGLALETASATTAIGIFVEEDERDNAGQIIRRGVKKFLTHGDTAEDLTQYDVLIYASETWRIVAAKKLQPAATKLLYELEIEQ